MKRFLLLIFFLSGVTGLTYEVLIFRKFKLLFGITSHSTALVFTIFLAGLGLGAGLGGLICRKISKPKTLLTVYAASEIVAGIIGMLMPQYFSIIDYIYTHIDASGLIIKFLLAFPGTMLLTVMLGTTLPLVINAAVDNDTRFSAVSRVGLFYGINTLGAVLGALLPVILLFSWFGINYSFVMTGIANVMLGSAVFLYLRRRVPDYITKPDPEVTSVPATAGDKIPELLVVFITGFLTLGLEILWTRYLIFLVGSTIYSFSLMLAAMLAGLGLGSLWINYRGQRFTADSIPGYITILLLSAGLLSFFPVVWYDQIVMYYPYLVSRVLEAGLAAVFSTHLLAVSVLLLPFTFMSGAILPLAVFKFRNAGLGTGIVYAVNTIGSIVGSLVTGFLLVGLLSIEHSLVLLSLLFMITGFIYRFRRTGAPVIGKTALVITVLFLVMAAVYYPGWNRLRFSYTGYYYGVIEYSKYSMRDLLSLPRTGYALDYFFDGREATFAVDHEIADPRQKRLLINGKVEAGTGDISNMTLCAWYPYIFHPQPRSGLVIGFGSGMSLSVLRRCGIPDLTLVELEPDLIAAGGCFQDWNSNIQADTAVNWVIDDARHFLLKTDKNFDIIVAEPSNPWISGIANLFTREALDLYARRLTPNGILSFWIPLYNFSADDLNILMSTIRSSFKFCKVFMIKSDLTVLCSNAELNYSVAKAAGLYSSQYWLDLRTAMNQHYWYDPYKLCVMDNDLIDKHYTRPGLNTDDNLSLEMRLPAMLLSPQQFMITNSVMETIFRNSQSVACPLAVSDTDTPFFLETRKFALPLNPHSWIATDNQTTISHPMISEGGALRVESVVSFTTTFACRTDSVSLELRAFNLNSDYKFDYLKQYIFQIYPPPYLRIGGGLILDNPSLFILSSSLGRDYPDRFIAAWYDRETGLVNTMVLRTTDELAYLDETLPEKLIQGIHR